MGDTRLKDDAGLGAPLPLELLRGEDVHRDGQLLRGRVPGAGAHHDVDRRELDRAPQQGEIPRRSSACGTVTSAAAGGSRSVARSPCTCQRARPGSRRCRPVAETPRGAPVPSTVTVALAGPGRRAVGDGAANRAGLRQRGAPPLIAASTTRGPSARCRSHHRASGAFRRGDGSLRTSARLDTGPRQQRQVWNAVPKPARSRAKPV